GSGRAASCIENGYIGGWAAAPRNTAAVLVVLVPAGITWVAVLSGVKAELQLFLPAWVRGRALSIYQTVMYGSQAFGALLASFLCRGSRPWAKLVHCGRGPDRRSGDSAPLAAD